MNPAKTGGEAFAGERGGRFYFALVCVVLTVVTAATTVFVVDLNRNFLISASDTSVFQNTLVNLVHGHGFRVTAYSGPNLLGQHGMFILALLAPLYALAPSVEMLFSLQVVVVFSAVFPVFFIAREILRKEREACLIAMLALTSPLLFEMAAAPFHPESGILAAVLWSYYFYRRNHSVGFWISFALAVSCAEQAALIYVALGLALFATEDGLEWRRRYAKWTLIGGAAWLVFTLGLLIPAIYKPGQLNVMRYHYEPWGAGSTAELAMAVTRDPVRALEFLLNPARWLYVLELVGVPLALGLIFPRALLLLAPFPFYFLLSDHEFFLNFHAYYFQFAFFAGYAGLIGLLARPDFLAGHRGILLAAMFAVNLVSLYFVSAYFSALAMDRDERTNGAIRAALATIPVSAGVYGPARFSAYLSNRPNVVMGDLREENLDWLAQLNEEFAFTDMRPDQVDYIVCDVLNEQCGPRLSGFRPDEAKSRAANITRFIRSHQWEIYWNQGDVVILRRAGNEGQRSTANDGAGR